MTANLCRSIAAVALAGLTALAPVAPVYGQNQGQAPNSGTVVSVGPDYTKPKPPVWNFLAPYTPIHLPTVPYVNTPQIGQMVRGGKLSLSVQDAVELALQNNPDIAVQRYYSWLAETDILRSKGGGVPRGSANVVTTAAVLANLNLPNLTYDPTSLMSGSVDSRLYPANNPLTSGVGTNATTAQSLATHTETGDFQYNQAFHTGTSISVTLDNTRSTTTSPSVFFNPLVQSTGTLAVNQPLLNGFGLLVNERYIRVAIITKKVVDYAFQQSLITDLTAVEDDYWELVFARGNVIVNQEAVDEAQELLNENRRQVQVGTLAPIDVIRAEAQLATAQQGLITAQTAQLQAAEIVLLSVIAKDPNAPELRGVEIIPTDTMQSPPQIEDIPLTDAVNEATQDRPDVLESKINIDADDINVKATKNNLLPSLNLSAYATYVGIGGDSKITSTSAGPGTAIDIAGTSTPVEVLSTNGGITPIELILPNTTTATTGIKPGGLGDALTTFFQGKYPEFEAQVSLTLPIRNRVAQADSTHAILTQRQDVARYQQVVNAATVDVQNAQITLKQDRAVVIASQKARELQEATLDSDQKKLNVGATTNFVVVTDQQNLAAARSAEVRAEANLEEARVNFERAMGRTLAAKRITIANAKSGASPRDTLIPGTSVNGEVIGMKEALASMPNGPR